jgi:hypothetical protein
MRPSPTGISSVLNNIALLHVHPEDRFCPKDLLCSSGRSDASAQRRGIVEREKAVSITALFVPKKV